jgi:predicted nucleic-acid-binding protein
VIGLDTNVLIRYLTQDDPAQSAKANQLIEKRLTHSDPGFISIVVMVEAAWVLDRAYGFSRQEIASAIERILQSDVFVVQYEQDIFTAMVLLRAGHGSFADALIGELGATAGCSHTCTFDRRTIQLPTFRLL